ncbi:MAG: putative baseplate assembly protein, partial [Anaerolineae bacterium]|nr:putative baseplate assembly protein [Anaerolineae bacterium]
KTLSIQGASAPSGTSGTWSASDGRRAVLIRREGAQLHVYALPEPVAGLQAHGPEETRPALTLYSPNAQDVDRIAWTPARRLLDSHATSREFVVEVESDGIAQVRFGDDHFGRRPESGDAFDAVYRVGNGARGNVGAGTLAHIVTGDAGIAHIWNPLPAFGGADPEAIEHVRQMAPYVFRNQERAVTPQDYADVATQHPQVQRASATLRWTGSWYTVTLTVDRLGGLAVDADFKELLLRYMERYRMAGHDLEIEEPHYVPLEIALRVCVNPDYFRADVAEALQQVYSAHTRPDGTRGIFHPDNFTFGQHVYLSQIYAAAQDIAGIDAYEVAAFQRLGVPSRKALDEGKLILGRLEIARLDNDPNFPEHGIFRLKLEGGR